MADWYTPRYLDWEQAAFILNIRLLRLRQKLVGFMFDPKKILWRPKRVEMGCHYCLRILHRRRRDAFLYRTDPMVRSVYPNLLVEE